MGTATQMMFDRLFDDKSVLWKDLTDGIDERVVISRKESKKRGGGELGLRGF
jgi:hypothetical protein